MIKTEKNDKKDTEALRVDFDEEDTKRFRDLQSLLGIQNKSDVLRFCLNFTSKHYTKIINI